MKWLDRLLGTPPDEERAEDLHAIEELRESFDRVHRRTDRLEKELIRVNAQLKARQR